MIWESLANAEYLAEQFPEMPSWEWPLLQEWLEAATAEPWVIDTL